MKLRLARILFSILGLPVSAFATNAVVNMSHYDLLRPDFGRMKAEGIIGVIHEASYPRFERDAFYGVRQDAATQAGLLWGAYHYGNGTDPIRQADHFLSVVSNAWTNANSSLRPNGILLVLDFEKNGHYPGGTMRVDQAVAFVERIKQRTGKYPGIYSGEYYLHKALNSSRVSAAQKRTLSNCWLWMANYGAAPRPASPWERWQLWQYCGDGRCRLPRSTHPIGVANVRKAERNIFAGSRGELTAFWSGRAWQPGGEKPTREAPATVAER
jgi:lysozyme